MQTRRVTIHTGVWGVWQTDPKSLLWETNLLKVHLKCLTNNQLSHGRRCFCVCGDNCTQNRQKTFLGKSLQISDTFPLCHVDGSEHNTTETLSKYKNIEKKKQKNHPVALTFYSLSPLHMPVTMDWSVFRSPWWWLSASQGSLERVLIAGGGGCQPSCNQNTVW